MKVPYIPKELLDIILGYDGRIKYKNEKYVNIIHKHDKRYNIIKLVISKKMEIMKGILFDYLDSSNFYFEFAFDGDNRMGLCFDYSYSFDDKFEICYYNTRNGSEEITTYL